MNWEAVGAVGETVGALAAQTTFGPSWTHSKVGATRLADPGERRVRATFRTPDASPLAPTGPLAFLSLLSHGGGARFAARGGHR